MKKLTLFTVLGVLISLLINFGSLANVNLINNTAMAKGLCSNKLDSLQNNMRHDLYTQRQDKKDCPTYSYKDAKGVEMQNSQADTKNTPNCALNQYPDCSETLLSQTTSQLVGVWKLTNYETKTSPVEVLVS